ncbi:hypothetical protein QUF74_00050 [Candidatus Halobeggiatoa sp. HSG11]|nr:hypothetical protein [Candidatus Halobeggiatoa sp. HSG11]
MKQDIKKQASDKNSKSKVIGYSHDSYLKIWYELYGISKKYQSDDEL